MRQALVIWTYYFYYLNVIAFILDAQSSALWYISSLSLSLVGHFMIRKFSKADLDKVMQIWLFANMDAHHFIPKSYWESNFEMVKGILPAAEVYVYENPDKNELLGFIGLTDNYIAGLFVRKDVQSQGIGKELLDYAKEVKDHLSLSVY